MLTKLNLKEKFEIATNFFRLQKLNLYYVIKFEAYFCWSVNYLGIIKNFFIISFILFLYPWFKLLFWE